ncbi:hypothetical protein D3C78_1595000 [compost metagenome]
MTAVKRRVEARHLRYPGAAFTNHADGRQVVGLMQRRQRRERIQLGQHGIVHQHRFGQVRPAMHHAVSHRQRRAAQVAA